MPELRDFNKLKKALFDKYFGFLNAKQREAVYTTEGPLLVLAGAGSGKTTVIVNRIANLVLFGKAAYFDRLPAEAEKWLPIMETTLKNGGSEQIKTLLKRLSVDPVDPEKILCITFTNKAAGEFKERLKATLGQDAEKIWAGTFHSVCVRILRKYAKKIGFGNDFTIYDTDDSKKLVSDVLKSLGIQESVLPPRSVLGDISAFKESGRLPADVRSEAGRDVRLIKTAEVYAEYQKRLREANALDFDDIIMYTVRLFEDEPDVIGVFRDKFDYILVDEYQDTNPSQSRLVALLAGDKKNVCVVGDDDQSIYAFRGATVENILGFDDEYIGAKIIRLEQNYRSTGNILKAANGIIENNIGRKGKELWTEAGDGEKIQIKRFFDQSGEASFICDTIKKRVENGEKYSDFAVLYRVNALSANLETAFVKKRIPYKIVGGLRFFERKEVKDILAYLSVIANTTDEIRLLRIINVPRRSIGEATIDKIKELAFKENVGIFEIMTRACSYSELNRVSPKVERFASLISELKEFSDTHDLPATVEKVIDATGYRDMLLEDEDEEKAKEREANILELVSSAKLFAETSETPTLAEFLSELALVSDVDDYDENSDSVVLMTVHSAKGLEFPVVFIPGFEEGMFPSSQSLSEGDRGLEEERRLAYVAVTRAKTELYLLHTSNRMLYGRTETKMISRFAGEIPREVCERGTVRDSSGHTAAPVSAYSTRHNESRNNFLESIRHSSEKKPEAAEVIPAGSKVSHGLFGEGTVISATPMGGDVLYEIDFVNGGKKRLMGNFAKLKKL